MTTTGPSSTSSAISSSSSATSSSAPPPPTLSLELLAALLARNAAAATHLQHQQQAPSMVACQQPFPQSAAPGAIQQLLRATNPLLSTATTTPSSATPPLNPAALLQHALLMAAATARNAGAPAPASVKVEEEQDELELDDSGIVQSTPMQRGLKAEEEAEDEQLLDNNNIEIDVEMMKEEEGEVVKQDPDSAQHNPAQPQQQRRQRVGGSSVKTAEVWRFFTQRPPPEQAATCQICQKTIKATNSSTTGMIRHLRSCHQQEFQQLQQARYLKNLKNDAVERQKVLLQLQLGIDPHSEASIEAIQAALESSFSALQSPPLPANKHSVEALINGAGVGDPNRSCSPSAPFAHQQLPVEQRQLLEQIENFKTSRPTSMERQRKEGAATEGGGGGKRVATGELSPQSATNAIDVQSQDQNAGAKRRKAGIPTEATMLQQTPRAPKKSSNNGNSRKSSGNLSQNNSNGTTPPVETAAAVKQPRTVHDRINDQIGAMMLVDQTEFLLDRVGFRQFVQSVLPGYQMPSADQFRAQILPRVAKQLREIALFREELQRNNPFGLPPSGFGFGTRHAQSSASSGSPPSSCPIINNNLSVISPSSSTEESGFHDDETPQQHSSNNVSGSGTSGIAPIIGLDELVQQAAFHSQNISRSFTYSIDLNGDGSGENNPDAGGKGSKGEEDSDTTSSV